MQRLALGDIDETQIVRKPFIGNELADKVQTALANSAGNSTAKSLDLGDSHIFECPLWVRSGRVTYTPMSALGQKRDIRAAIQSAAN